MTTTNCDHVMLISAIAAAMREHGVQRYRSGGIEVVLGPAPATGTAETRDTEPALKDVVSDGGRSLLYAAAEGY